MADGAYLGEIPEWAATGTVSSTYEDVRRVLGVPMVALVYRALASEPGRLERVWAQLRPNLLSGLGSQAAAELADLPFADAVAIPGSALRVTGFDQSRTAATLEAFRRVNSANVLAVHALLAGREAQASPPGAAIGPAPPAEGQTILPILDLDKMPATTRALLEEMSEPIAGDERPLLIPSLLRALANNPCLLALLWSVLRPLLTSEAFRTEAIHTAERAERLAHRLPYKVTRIEDEVTRNILRRFARTIPAMLVAGSMLESALAEASAARL